MLKVVNSPKFSLWNNWFTKALPQQNFDVHENASCWIVIANWLYQLLSFAKIENKILRIQAKSLEILENWGLQKFLAIPYMVNNYNSKLIIRPFNYITSLSYCKQQRSMQKGNRPSSKKYVVLRNTNCSWHVLLDHYIYSVTCGNWLWVLV